MSEVDIKPYLLQGLVEGLEKQAFTKDEAEAIAKEIVAEYENLEKMASIFNNFETAKYVVKPMVEGGAKAVGAIAAGGLAGAGLLGMAKLYKNTVAEPILHKKFRTAVDQAIVKNQVLQHADRARVDSMAETIFKYAPNASADANLLSSILSNAVMMDGIDPQMIQSLVNLERSYGDSRRLEPNRIIA